MCGPVASSRQLFVSDGLQWCCQSMWKEMGKRIGDYYAWKDSSDWREGGGKEGAHSLMWWCARLGLLLRLCLVDRATLSSSLVHLIAYIQEHNQHCSSNILHANSWHLSKSAVAWHLHSLLKICQMLMCRMCRWRMCWRRAEIWKYTI